MSVIMKFRKTHQSHRHAPKVMKYGIICSWQYCRLGWQCYEVWSKSDESKDVYKEVVRDEVSFANCHSFLILNSPNAHSWDIQRANLLKCIFWASEKCVPDRSWPSGCRLVDAISDWKKNFLSKSTHTTTNHVPHSIAQRLDLIWWDMLDTSLDAAKSLLVSRITWVEGGWHSSVMFPALLQDTLAPGWVARCNGLEWG